jgi:RNA polymerase sigma-70 factor (ECF subfamily)
VSSADLMQRYCEGDHRAFRELYAATARRLLHYLRSLIHDDAMAEDILQQTFLKLHGARSIYVRGMDPVRWLYAIARRTCIDEMRRRRQSRVRLLHGSEELLPEVEATTDGTTMHAVAEEPYSEAECAAVLEALGELPAGQRAALGLTKIQGLTMRDAARALGTTEGAMKLRAHRGYARLRALLGQDEMFRERLEASAATGRRSRRSRRAARWRRSDSATPTPAATG